MEEVFDILISQEPEPLVPQETLYANNIVRRANDIVGARLSEDYPHSWRRSYEVDHSAFSHAQ